MTTMARSPRTRASWLLGTSEFLVGAVSSNPIPVGDVPYLAVPGIQQDTAERVRMGRHAPAMNQRDQHVVLNQHVVQGFREVGPFAEIDSKTGGRPLLCGKTVFLRRPWRFVMRSIV